MNQSKTTKKKGLSLPAKIFLALLAGCLFGIAMNWLPSGGFRDEFIANGVLKIGGAIFMNAFRLLIGPIVFVSLALGVAAMDTPFTVGRIGIKTLFLYFITTLAAILLGIGMVGLFKPGLGLDIPIATVENSLSPQQISWADTIINVVPANVFRAFTDNAMLQIIFLGILCGIGLVLLGEKAKRLALLLSDLNELNIKIIEIVMQFAPIGVFCLIASTVMQYGASALLPLAKYLFCLASAMLLLFVVLYFPMLHFLAKIRMSTFLKRFYPVMVIGFSTSSSNAALPANIEVLIKKFGVREDISTMVLSLGATINMNGTAIMLSGGAIFLAQFYGINLSLFQLSMIILTSLTAALGTAGIPGAGTLMLIMVLQAAELPLEGVAIMMGIDRFADMLRTTVNITGDAVCACVVGRSEKALDDRVFAD